MSSELTFLFLFSMLHINNAGDGPGLNIVAILDPLSNDAQKLSPVLMVRSLH